MRFERLTGIAKDERGALMAQAFILVLLLAGISTVLIRISLDRHMVVHRAESGQKARLLAEGAEAHVHACLSTTDFGRTSCSLSGVSCLPTALEGRRVTVSSGGSPPLCTLNIRVGD